MTAISRRRNQSMSLLPASRAHRTVRSNGTTPMTRVRTRLGGWRSVRQTARHCARRQHKDFLLLPRGCLLVGLVGRCPRFPRSWRGSRGASANLPRASVSASAAALSQAAQRGALLHGAADNAFVCSAWRVRYAPRSTCASAPAARTAGRWCLSPRASRGSSWPAPTPRMLRPSSATAARPQL